jgi:hypothetical protein
VNILRFEMNVPMEVALQSAEGVAIEGRYGTRMMFSLADGHVMYVPLIVATKIKAEGILPGERFDLCKAAVKTGKKRSVEWLLERIDPGQAREGAANSMAPDAPETPLEHDLRVSAEMAKNKAGLRPQPAPCSRAEEIPPSAPLDEPHLGSNGNNGAQTLSKNVPSAPTTKLEQALRTAISAAHNAEKFGSELGYVVRFDADAIKAMAITVLINMSERVAR